MTRTSVKRLQTIARRLVVALVVLSVASVLVLQVRWHYREQRYNQLIEQIAARHGLGEDFKYVVKAVVRRESEFDPTAAGRAGEIGLMQVTPGAAEDWVRLTNRSGFHLDQLWDPATNIEAGSWYLARALRRWQQADDPLPFALAEYNAGLGNVRKWLPPDQLPPAAEFIERITYPMVREYITVVERYAGEYRVRGRL